MIPGGGCVVGRWGRAALKPFIYEAREQSFVCVYLDCWIYWATLSSCTLLYSAVLCCSQQWCCTLLPCFHFASSLHHHQCLRVNEEGELTGSDLAYLYPDLKTAIVGTFEKVQCK